MSKEKNEILGVIFDRDPDIGPIVDSDRSMFYLPYFKDEEYFSSYENEIIFYKGVESLVRKHSFYSKYINYLIEVVGINTCQVLSNIEVGDKKQKITFEMHHGPILTLFDIVMVVTNHLRVNGEKKLTTFKVADIVLEEHRLNNIRTVLLTKSVHQQVHDDNIMLNYNQGYGDTGAFLKKYKDGITRDMAHKINEYIKWSIDNDSFDNDVFKISEDLKRWGNNDFDNLGERVSNDD
jgi:uncharacterized protein YajQ (UPF0234 family)